MRILNTLFGGFSFGFFSAFYLFCPETSDAKVWFRKQLEDIKTIEFDSDDDFSDIS